MTSEKYVKIVCIHNNGSIKLKTSFWVFQRQFVSLMHMCKNAGIYKCDGHCTQNFECTSKSLLKTSSPQQKSGTHHFRFAILSKDG